MGVIDLVNVSRRFGDLIAVDGITLSVGQGEIFGLLGHNGAGKTTLLRVINGLLPPDDGTVRVWGLDPQVHGERVRRSTGVLTEYPALDEYLTVRENLEVYAAINAVPKHIASRTIDSLLERLDLATRDNTPTRDLSAGLKQRVAIARALVHDPDVLLLDEPTTNMDPVAARRVRDMIVDASRRRGHTVLLSTHNLAEAEEICDRVAIVGRGRLLTMGTPTELRLRSGGRGATRITTDPDSAARAVSMLPSGTATAVDDQTMILNAATPVSEAVAQLVQAGVRVHAVVPDRPSLEDLYVRLHSVEVAEQGATG